MSDFNLSAGNNTPGGSDSGISENTKQSTVTTTQNKEEAVKPVTEEKPAPVNTSENKTADTGDTDIETIDLKSAEKPDSTPADTSETVQLTPVRRKKDGKKKMSRKTKKRIRTLIILGVIVGLIVFGVIYIRNRFAEGMSQLMEQMKADVTPTQVERKDLVKNISVTGTVKSNESRTQITTLMTNGVTSAQKILKVNVEVGDYVNEGDVLVMFSTEDIEKEIARTQEDLTRQRKLDNINAADSQRNYVYSYQQAADSLSDNSKSTDRALKALYEACDAYGDAKKKLQESKDELEEAKANGNQMKIAEIEGKLPSLENAVAQAKATEERAQQTYDDAVASESSSRQGGIQTIENQLSEADSQYQKSIISAGEQARQKERTLKDQQDKLEDYVVTASMSGLVTKVNVSEGNSFSNGEVVTIQDVSKLKVEAEIDEYDISSVKKGQRVLVKTEATGDEEFDGVVSHIAPTSTKSTGTAAASAAAGTSATPTYTVTVDILDKDERIMLDMTAKLSIIVDQKDSALCVPYDAIGTDADGNSVVYVLDDMSLLDKGSAKDKDGKDKKDAGIIVENGISGTERKINSPGGNLQDDSDIYHELVIEKGMETEYYTEIITDKLKPGDYIVIKNENTGNDLMNLMMGGGAPMR